MISFLLQESDVRSYSVLSSSLSSLLVSSSGHSMSCSSDDDDVVELEPALRIEDEFPQSSIYPAVAPDTTTEELSPLEGNLTSEVVSSRKNLE